MDRQHNNSFIIATQAAFADKRFFKLLHFRKPTKLRAELRLLYSLAVHLREFGRPLTRKNALVTGINRHSIPGLIDELIELRLLKPHRKGWYARRPTAKVRLNIIHPEEAWYRSYSSTKFYLTSSTDQLTPRQFMLYYLLWQQHKRKKEPTINQLAGLIGVSKLTVLRGLKRLKELQLIAYGRAWNGVFTLAAHPWLIKKGSPASPKRQEKPELVYMRRHKFPLVNRDLIIAFMDKGISWGRILEIIKTCRARHDPVRYTCHYSNMVIAKLKSLMKHLQPIPLVTESKARLEEEAYWQTVALIGEHFPGVCQEEAEAVISHYGAEQAEHVLLNGLRQPGKRPMFASTWLEFVDFLGL